MAKREIEGQREFTKQLWGLLEQKGLTTTVFRHVDLFTKGHPDTSVNANSKTVWFEFKRWDGFLRPSQGDNARKVGNLWIITFLPRDEVQAENLCLKKIVNFPSFVEAARFFVDFF